MSMDGVVEIITGREGRRRDFRVSKAAGKIICMSSVRQVIPWAGHANYAASKGGINMLMQSVAQEMAPFFIRVNSIGPGARRTPSIRPLGTRPRCMAA